jgi:hypothetical protein
VRLGKVNPGWVGIEMLEKGWWSFDWLGQVKPF